VKKTEANMTDEIDASIIYVNQEYEVRANQLRVGNAASATAARDGGPGRPVDVLLPRHDDAKKQRKHT
jgi:hypothetical protein